MAPISRVDIAPILGDLGSSLQVSGVLDIDSYRMGDDQYALLSKPAFEVTITNTGTGIVVYGTVYAVSQAICARCANEFPLEVASEVEGFFIRPGDEEGIPGEQEFDLIQGDDYIDIGGPVLAGVVYGTPFAALCHDGCRGLCTRCGVDLNDTTCSCRHEIDELNPFIALAGLDLPGGVEDSQD